MPRKSKERTARGKPLPVAPNRQQYGMRVYAKYGYVRARNMIMAQFKISHTTAERDLRRIRKQMADDAEAERPHLRERLTAHLTQVAGDAHRAEKFSAAVMADRAIAKLNGLEVDVVQVGAVSAEQQAALSALVLTPHERRERERQLRRQQGVEPGVARAKATEADIDRDADE